jgi:DNA topoisomerase I
MKTKLIIVESPSKCKKIEEYAGSEYKCLATCGHIYSLDKLSDIDIDNNYKPKYRMMKTKKKNLDAIEKYLTTISSDNIYLATDPDREGEAIAWHICQHFKLDVLTTHRIVFNEITKHAVCNSLENPRTIDMNMVKSQQARQTIDVIVGFKTCPILWKHLGIGDSKSPISAGRCQTPCLKLVYDLYNREKDKNTRVKYKLNANIDIDRSIKRYTKETQTNNKNNNSMFYSCILNINSVNNSVDKDIINVLTILGKYCDFEMTRTNPIKTTLKAPKPLTTSLLQQKVNQYLGMSPNVTMKTAQKLYERGLITYMRTDSQRYSKEFIKSAVEYIKKNSSTLFINIDKTDNPTSKDIDPTSYIIENPYIYETNKSTKENSQDGHESIRPTDLNTNIKTIEDITSPEVKLYYYIYIHSLQTFIKDAIVESYSIVLQPVYNNNDINKNDNNELVNKITLKSSLRRYYFDGWKSIKSTYKTQDTQSISDTSDISEHSYDSCLDNDDEIIHCRTTTNTYIYNKYMSILKDTSTTLLIDNDELININAVPYLSGGVSYYSEANIVKQLEEKQIGRPSTYASLVDKIQSRHYVFKMDINQKSIDTTKYEYYNTYKKQVDVINYVLETPLIKNRIVIQELGKNVIHFCYRYFDTLFNYNYTASLERMLDMIASGETTYEDVCKSCDTSVDKCIKNINTKKGDTIKNEESSNLSNSNNSFIDFTKEHTNERILGLYKDAPLIIKSGIYGYYAQHGKEKHSLRHMNMIDIDDFIYDNVVSFIEKKQQDNDEKLIRTIDDKISIWKGVKGKSDYIMIKASHNKNYKYKSKPQFISLKTFKHDYLMCDVERIQEFIKEITEK